MMIATGFAAILLPNPGACSRKVGTGFPIKSCATKTLPSAKGSGGL
jgi:hypothetical protein